jgi:transposase-like protein
MELVSSLRVVHILNAIMMAWPTYALVAVNQRYYANPRCEYFSVSAPALHALVADGKRKGVQMWQCQACQHHVCDSCGTFLCGKKKAPETIRAVLSDLCHGHGIRQTAHDHGVNKNTVVAWLTQFGERAPLLWQLLAEGKLHVATIQLDELKTFVHKKGRLLSTEEKALGEVGSQWGVDRHRSGLQTLASGSRRIPHLELNQPVVPLS